MSKVIVQKRHITEGFEERLLMLIESTIFIHFLILHHLCTKVGNYLDQIWKRLVTSQRRVCLPWWRGRYYGKNRIRPHIVAHGLHLNQQFCLSWCLFEFTMCLMPKIPIPPIQDDQDHIFWFQITKTLKNAFFFSKL